MNYLKKIGISMLWIIGIIIISTLLMTLLSYFNILGDKFVSVLKIIIPILALFIGGMKIGKSSKKKGWLEGLKLSMIFLIIIVLINLIFFNNLELKNLIYYLILLISTTFGSMIGINKNSQ